MLCRTLHYIKEEGGEWQGGTITSGVNIIGFTETNDVSANTSEDPLARPVFLRL